MEGREDSGRGRLLTSQGEKPQKKPTLPIPLAPTLSLQTMRKKAKQKKKKKKKYISDVQTKVCGTFMATLVN